MAVLVHLKCWVDRAIKSMVRIRTKSCDRCQLSAEILYRIQVDRADPWQFVCVDCWQTISQTLPNYVYGGTWKARKR